METLDKTRQKYFMDDPREGDRLAKKVDAHAFVSDYLSDELARFSSGNILEAGCGPGVFLEEIGKNYPQHVVTGIDISANRVEQANTRIEALPNANALQADIYDLPFDNDQFDLIYSRFLFEYLKEPVKAAQELLRVCKPGGTLIIQDLDGQFTFYPALSNKLESVLTMLKTATGFDANVGRKLYAIGRSAGFNFHHLTSGMYHNYFGSIDYKNLELWKLKLDIAFKNISHLFGDDIESLKDEMLKALLDEDSVMFSYLFTATFKK